MTARTFLSSDFGSAN